LGIRHTLQRTDRGDQRPPRAPTRLRHRVPRPHRLHRQEPARDRRVQAATTPVPRVRPRVAMLGTSYARAIRPQPTSGTRQLTLKLSPGGNCFVVCGGAPCPAIVQAWSGPRRRRRPPCSPGRGTAGNVTWSSARLPRTGRTPPPSHHSGDAPAAAKTAPAQPRLLDWLHACRLRTGGYAALAAARRREHEEEGEPQVA
jgi:hypothetical protein